MKIAFVTGGNPLDKGTWSGIYYHMGRSLQSYGHEVDFLGPVKPIERHWGKLRNKITNLFFRKFYDFKHSLLLAKGYARIFEKKLAVKKYDVIFAPAASVEIALLKTIIPIVYTSDATFDALKGYYGSFSNFVNGSEADKIEYLALHNSTLVTYPSQWAATSAISHYQVNSKKIHQIEYGANLEQVPNLVAKNTESLRNLNLLFFGVDWLRKGGSVAVEVLAILRSFGINAHLTVCGCNPDTIQDNPNITVIPFLDKNQPQDQKTIDELLIKAHFLILPSAKECFGIVFCEASAYGIPSLAYNTGGVNGAINDGINGYLLPENSTAMDFANKIIPLIQNPALYVQISNAARKMYETKLNWTIWAEKMTILFDSVVSPLSESSKQKVAI